MIVICKKGTKRLIKGHRYEVESLYNGGGNQRWIEGKLTLKDVVGRFSVGGFTDTDGKPIPTINISGRRNTTSIPRLDFDSLKTGDILVCTSDSFTLFAKNCMYKISDLNKIVEQRKNWNGQTYNHTELKIKFEGINRWLKFSSWKFRALTTEELRENQLNSVLLGKEPEVVKSKDVRKIDLTTNKNLELIKILSETILDTNRHHLDVIDWAVEKTGTKLKINREDFAQLLDMKLSDILKIIDNK